MSKSFVKLPPIDSSADPVKRKDEIVALLRPVLDEIIEKTGFAAVKVEFVGHTAGSSKVELTITPANSVIGVPI